MAFSSLAEWLQWIEQQHPTEIELGLERVAAVADRMQLAVDVPVVTVAGTNGKGSCVALAAAILKAAGYRCGVYTSPHLLRYNERVAVDGQCANDQQLCHAFGRVQLAQGDTSLTYFEFGTLAALQIFKDAAVDVVVLEVGLGGRLDAVNIIEPTVALVTSVDLDHQAWLGETREAIGWEKAGVFRANRGAIMGDPLPVASVEHYANQLGAILRRRGREFDYQVSDETWNWRGIDPQGTPLQLDGLPVPSILLDNAATVLQALPFLPFNISVEAIAEGLRTVQLTGRGELVEFRGRRVRLNVAHNPAALRAMLNALPVLNAGGCRRAVFSVLADKTVAEMVELCRAAIDRWYVAELANSPRALPLSDVAGALDRAGVAYDAFDDGMAAAFKAALSASTDEDEVLVFGSFFTVAAILEFIAGEQQTITLRGQQ
ncbi:bifunctional tetrahydrofolate synthase/dihydrofolate synthase [Spongiibacter taiwanensis]|uniref:bifunctional tetrahydrofolate synthase/dihydrofolate synthase n=1 Tax=Spongiibacter taiwanensis TaxID=1748242 RepID=UPI002034D973|nr:bifunctional tetrahydrofolate synthase/dihydrofolate synthase [Spongiibacter taiwanensis]USA43198.1 bifunctional tetrahydrofolate synthase/dihydrofolate synthase [Spongiibacter taiwanensis]